MVKDEDLKEMSKSKENEINEKDEFEEDDLNIPLWIVVGVLSLIGFLLQLFFGVPK